jgi:hypothetical protein
VEATETGAAKEKAAGVSVCPENGALGFPRGHENSDLPSHMTPGDPGSSEARGSESHAAGPSAGGWGWGWGWASVLALVTMIVWRCWRPSRKRATCGAWEAVTPS